MGGTFNLFTSYPYGETLLGSGKDGEPFDRANATIWELCADNPELEAYLAKRRYSSMAEMRLFSPREFDFIVDKLRAGVTLEDPIPFSEALFCVPPHPPLWQLCENNSELDAYLKKRGYSNIGQLKESSDREYEYVVNKLRVKRPLEDVPAMMRDCRGINPPLTDYPAKSAFNQGQKPASGVDTARPDPGSLPSSNRQTAFQSTSGAASSVEQPKSQEYSGYESSASYGNNREPYKAASSDAKPASNSKWLYRDEELKKPLNTSQHLTLPGQNRPLTQFELEDFEKLRKRVSAGHSRAFDTVMSLSDIAKEEADRCLRSKDRKGWLYLSDFLRRWPILPKNGNAPDPYMIDWDWIMQYDRARVDYESFLSPAGYYKIFSEKALEQLGKILKREGCLVGDGKEFNFINSNPREWERLYFNQRPINTLEIWPDGLQAALGGFNMRALANGRTERQPDGRYKIYIDQVAVYARDIFNLEGNAYLGGWSKRKMRFMPFSIDDNYIDMTNGVLRDFSDAFGMGHNFEVLSNAHRVEGFKGFSYVF